MSRIFGLLFVATLVVAPSIARPEGTGGQRGSGHERGGHEFGGGVVPRYASVAFHGAPIAHEHGFVDRTGHPNAPHVHTDGNWFGHDWGRSDGRFQLDHPFEHGRLPERLDFGHVYHLGGGDMRRFSLGGFSLASPDGSTATSATGCAAAIRSSSTTIRIMQAGISATTHG